MTKAVIEETINPITPAVTMKGKNLGALRMSTSAVLVVSGLLATRPLNQRKVLFYFGPGARGVNRASREGSIPGKIAYSEREPSFCRHLYNVRRRASSVARAGDALNRPERWNPHLDGVAFGAGAEFFEQVAHGSCELRLVSRAHGCDGLLTFDGFNASLHTSKLRG